MAVSSDDVCLPVNLDAFVLNAAVCDSGATRIAPITQPNYVSLRLDNSQIEHDVLPRIDLHGTQPALSNPRISTIQSGAFVDIDPKNLNPTPNSLSSINRSRLGVYLHWSLPRFYRSGASQATPPPPANQSSATGTDKPKYPDGDPNPTFRRVPSRWMVVRILREYKAPANVKPSMVTAWIIESDRLRKVEDLNEDENGQPIDLEADVSPFVAYDGDPNVNVLDSQAENYIGLKTNFAQWKEQNPSQSVKLTIMNSSNPLFADYAPHNANVFSTKDNFYCGNDQNGNPLYLDSAKCDYIVVGWHSRLNDDPLSAGGTDLQSRLRPLFLSAGDAARSSSLDKLRLVCHAAKYSVVFDEQKPATPSDDYAARFTGDVDMEPVSVGTSPLDSLLAFFQSHQKDKLEAELMQDPDSNIAESFMAIRELLYATEDDYDSRTKAADLVSTTHFARTLGGSVWRYGKNKPVDGSVQPPSDAESTILQTLNEHQRTYDAVGQKLNQLRWALFAEFFKFVSDPTSGTKLRADIYRTRVPLLSAEAARLNQMLKDKDKAVQDQVTKIGASNVKKTAADSFCKRKDPTLCIAGIDAGWDAEYLGTTPTRFPDQIKPGSGNADCVQFVNSILNLELGESNGLRNTISKLVAEATNGLPSALDQYGHKAWTAQPFYPQFVEWEGIYYDIKWENWDIALTSSALASSNHTWVNYKTTADLTAKPHVDQRRITGRMLVLPQPSFALGAVVAQVLDATPPDQFPESVREQFKDKSGRAEFVTKVQNMKFISGELSGLTDALLTMANGQHVKPNVRPNSTTLTPLKEAVDIGGQIGLKREDFEMMANQSGRTPYGTLEDFSAAEQYMYPFKAVQHGQFALTQLNIVDKFGQVIACPVPKTATTTPTTAVPDFLHPCLGELLIPSLLDDGKTLNTVVSPQQTHDHADASGTPMTPFIQLNPAINQEARINASFLKPNGSGWQICSEWDSPIFGWIIVNYADSALQFFTSTGIFYTSMEFGGPTGTIQAQAWRPFDPPTGSDAKVSSQLVGLINKMRGDGGAAYLLALWDTIVSATPSTPYPPSEYAVYANAIVGKPLALVNIGWSLELAQPPYWEQHTMPPPRANPDPTKPGLDPLRQDALDVMAQYHFKLKIGDAERPFDGLIAYWDSDTPATDFSSMWTYFPGPEDGVKGDPRQYIEPGSFPMLTPYFINPEDTLAGAGFVDAHTARMRVKTVLMDPYTAVHAYTGILPIKSVQLAGWTIQQALKNMTAFFTLGPLLLTKDVPKVYDRTHPLHPDSWLAAQDATQTSGPEPINLPIAGGKGMWQWLQPYRVAKDVVDKPVGQPTAAVVARAATATAPAGAGGVHQDPGLETRYNALAVGVEDGQLRRDPAPYTLVEGFLQLARALEAPSIPSAPAAVAASGAARR